MGKAKDDGILSADQTSSEKGTRMQLRHKFSAKMTECDGIKFPSKKEATYYKQLKFLQKSGEVLFFLRQVPFDLPGGIKYRLDFMEFHRNGDVILTEVKGYHTEMGKLKIKQVEDLYNVLIRIV